MISVLATVLPGVRDLRTPFTAGLLWLLLLWLTLGDHIAVAIATPAVHERLDGILQIFGAPAAAGAIGFSAYLVGVLFSWPNEWVDTLKLRRQAFWSLSQTERDYDAHLESAEGVIRAHRSSHEVLSWNQCLPDLEARLMIASPVLFGEYDRHASESAFRRNVALPLALILVWFGTQLAWPLAAGGIVMSVLLLVNSVGKQHRAEILLKRAIVDDIVLHPVVGAARSLLQASGQVRQVTIRPTVTDVTREESSVAFKYRLEVINNSDKPLTLLGYRIDADIHETAGGKVLASFDALNTAEYGVVDVGAGECHAFSGDASVSGSELATPQGLGVHMAIKLAVLDWIGQMYERDFDGTWRATAPGELRDIREPRVNQI